ncbi:hypothetical protein VOLCADRAFT_91332 [Volvox carteri f. nagariensis]|uniref:Uncharacterized protein n=1 Tax=Volvox carteri f. nagariensis TaxID=3068 RepID=D8TWS8_VOLCA|nr:uncharacterized protein VOLCADRAFT_91332 [Volvox carteri f. nagariensis]EFJ48204.1 hypothetical protein VOLCADRAFT_91332 [Volvox carteri f. nagariensis]|eukprot:XP_002950889.1 hypothetical protein VOLCADRAFT_91332 [Volvox carteri f. nagariensis]
MASLARHTFPPELNHELMNLGSVYNMMVSLDATQEDGLYSAFVRTLSKILDTLCTTDPVTPTNLLSFLYEVRKLLVCTITLANARGLRRVAVCRDEARARRSSRLWGGLLKPLAH